MDNFYTVSQLALEEIAEFFESSWRLADVDFVGETLMVTLPQKQQYVIHRHGISRQIWVASPFTGAHHFSIKDGQWYCTRTETRLQDFLTMERDSYAS